MAEPFHVRFNIEVPLEEARRRFVNRIANRIRRIVSALSLNDTLEKLLFEVEAKLGEPHLRRIDPGIHGEPDFVERWSEIIGGDFWRSLHAVEGFYHGLPGEPIRGYDPIQALNNAVQDTLAESECDVGVSWQDGFFSRKGAELLDENLVNEPLRWLADPKYDTVLVPFKKGLSNLLEGTRNTERYGDAVTDMYEALEAMVKIVTGKPSLELAGLREEFISKLRLPDTHKEMLKQYVEYGCHFRHAIKTGQKRSWPLEHEAENFVYMTGLFIRLAIQSQSI